MSCTFKSRAIFARGWVLDDLRASIKDVQFAMVSDVQGLIKVNRLDWLLKHPQTDPDFWE